MTKEVLIEIETENGDQDYSDQDQETVDQSLTYSYPMLNDQQEGKEDDIGGKLQ